ncbi:peptidase M14, partial [bacterium]|nr:peptidase M14 [bacterium]
NPEDLYDQLMAIAQNTGVKIYATNTSWVEEGANFGSGQVNYLKQPKIAMAYHLPTSSYSVGWARYLLEQEYDYPVTIINTLQLARADLSKYNVLILPHASGRFGGYKKVIGEGGANKIKQWVRDGGTLISIGEGTRWLTDEKVGLLATSREFKGGKPEKKDGKPDQPKGSSSSTSSNGTFDLEKAIQPEKELPGNTPGTIMRVSLDTEHWAAFGYDGDTNVMVAGRSIYTPIKLDKGRNVGVYMSGDKALISGFTWEETQKQIASKAYLMHQPHGRGHVIAFAEDPNYRAFCDGLNLLFLNAIFWGPAH